MKNGEKEKNARRRKVDVKKKTGPRYRTFGPQISGGPNYKILPRTIFAGIDAICAGLGSITQPTHCELGCSPNLVFYLFCKNIQSFQNLAKLT
jgi:hypothetical protein